MSTFQLVKLFIATLSNAFFYFGFGDRMSFEGYLDAISCRSSDCIEACFYYVEWGGGKENQWSIVQNALCNLVTSL